MASIASRILFAGSVLCALHVGIADAAQTGGSISLSGGAPGPGCLVTRQVPTTTVQDSFALAASTSCNGGSGSAQIHADALVPSIGLAASVINSSASAFVILSDLWTIGVAPGTAVGGTFSLPVAFHLEGEVTPGSLFGPAFGRFLDIGGSLGQFGTASGLFQFNSRVATTGRFDQTFSGLRDLHQLRTRSADTGGLRHLALHALSPARRSGLLQHPVGLGRRAARLHGDLFLRRRLVRGVARAGGGDLRLDDGRAGGAGRLVEAPKGCPISD